MNVHEVDWMLSPPPVGLGPCGLTLGNFDGLHLGHQQLLKLLQSESEIKCLPKVVLTFDPHPLQVLQPEKKLQKMYQWSDEYEVLQNWGVDHLVLQKFTTAFASLSATDFLQLYIEKNFSPQLIVVGDNFFFGKDRRGNPQFLQDYCKANNKTCIVVPAFYWQKEKVSSSLIRTALKDGDADKAKNLLGRPFRYSGVVIHGHHRGRSIGVPTANLQTAVQFSPRLGVYCSKLLWQGQSYPSITNVGINPTVTSSSNLKIETHVLQKDINLYDQSVAVDLLHFLRDEKKFASIEELKIQIQKDIQQAQGFFYE